MNAKRKKFIAFFLVFSLLSLSANLIAKETRGAMLVIQKKGKDIEIDSVNIKRIKRSEIEKALEITTEGRKTYHGILVKEQDDKIIITAYGKQVKGELIVIKNSPLLLKEGESGSDVSIDIKEIKVIIIRKKSKAWRRTGFVF